MKLQDTEWLSMKRVNAMSTHLWSSVYRLHLHFKALRVHWSKKKIILSRWSSCAHSCRYTPYGCMLILPPRTKLTRQAVYYRGPVPHTHAQSHTLTHWRSLSSINTPLDIHCNVQGAMETVAKEEIVQQSKSPTLELSPKTKEKHFIFESAPCNV